MSIVIIDYGAGNVGSVVNMLNALGAKPLVTSDKNKILSASHLILPGVGSFDHGMTELNNAGLTDVIRQYALEYNKPLLGICLGAQLLTKSSEEGILPGLGLFSAKTVKFEVLENIRLPHMGWNKVKLRKDCSLFADENIDDWRFYFVHKYHMVSDNSSDVLCECDYGNKFHAALSRDNIFALQFHPEKSHRFGLSVLKNFIEM